MTYRLQMQGEGKRLKREYQDRMSMVWHAAALERMKLPSHAEFTGIKPPPVVKQTPEEFRARFDAMREDAARA